MRRAISLALASLVASCTMSTESIVDFAEEASEEVRTAYCACVDPDDDAAHVCAEAQPQGIWTAAQVECLASVRADHAEPILACVRNANALADVCFYGASECDPEDVALCVSLWRDDLAACPDPCPR